MVAEGGQSHPEFIDVAKNVLCALACSRGPGVSQRNETQDIRGNEKKVCDISGSFERMSCTK
jgi:hypothetical protein